VTRWNRRLLLGAVAVLLPALAGCEAGLNAPTLQFHPASNGTTITHNGVTIDNAFVLGSVPGSALPKGGRAGVFMALVAENGDRLVSISAPGAASSVKVSGSSVNLPPQQLVDLSGPVPKVVLTGLTSSLVGGTTITMTFTFAEAGLVTVQVPVEARAYTYATYAPPPIPQPKVSVKPSATGSVSPAASGTASAGASAGATPTPSPTATP
jgi:copper(I)-binding protein